MRRAVTVVLAATAVALLGLGVWKNVPQSFRVLHSQYVAYAGDTRDQRDQAYGTTIPIDMGIIGFWRAGLRAGDRYWIQMPYEAFSNNGDKRYMARMVSHLYLLPAVEATSLAKANVVLSWDADPATLRLRYSEQQRAGLQLVFVSRIARGS
jgi:hypothetical protein